MRQHLDPDSVKITSAVAITTHCSARGTGIFLLFIFLGLLVLLLQLVFEIMMLIYSARQQNKLRCLRYRGGGFVELPPLTDKDFAHLPGLEASPCFHLFLSHAWPLGQDVCKLIKQRCREICPSLHVFLDVEDLVTGGGTKEVDHSLCILVFAMAVYFEKVNCVKELTRTIVRHKQITLLLPDSEVHGVFTQAMIREIVTDEWVARWKLEKKLAKWASDWGVAEVKTPTSTDICEALFKQPPLEWSRITPFQDRTMLLMCKRLLPEAKRDIYLQGAAGFKLPKKHTAVKVYCSPHNLGATELAAELNATFAPSKSRDIQRRHASNRGTGGSHGAQSTTASIRPLRWTSLSYRESPVAASRGQLLEKVESLDECDHILIYLTALTWTHEPEAFAAEIREAMRLGVHLQPCHEFPSVLDPESLRDALPFKEIMDATPADLTKSPRNIYSQIAIALKGGELRDVGLANLAVKLVQRVKRATIADDTPDLQSSNSRALVLAHKVVGQTSSKQLIRPLAIAVAPIDALTKQLVRKASSIDALDCTHQTTTTGIAMESSA